MKKKKKCFEIKRCLVKTEIEDMFPICTVTKDAALM